MCIERVWDPIALFGTPVGNLVQGGHHEQQRRDEWADLKNKAGQCDGIEAKGVIGDHLVRLTVTFNRSKLIATWKVELRNMGITCTGTLQHIEWVLESKGVFK